MADEQETLVNEDQYEKNFSLPEHILLANCSQSIETKTNSPAIHKHDQ